MDGKMGSCPDWYNYMHIARYLNTTVKELPTWPVWWIDKAVKGMIAENEGRSIQEQRQKVARS